MSFIKLNLKATLNILNLTRDILNFARDILNLTRDNMNLNMVPLFQVMSVVF